MLLFLGFILLTTSIVLFFREIKQDIPDLSGFVLSGCLFGGAIAFSGKLLVGMLDISLSPKLTNQFVVAVIISSVLLTLALGLIISTKSHQKQKRTV